VTDKIERKKYYYGDSSKLLISQEVPYRNGKIHGKMKYWNKQGLLDWEVPYKDDRVHGVERSWFDNGGPARAITYRNGTPDGISRSWHFNGQLKSESSFKNGLLEGLMRYWDEHGNLIEEVPYKTGHLHGVLKRWNKNGQLLSEVPYVNGDTHGTAKEWHENGRLKSNIPCNSRQIHGIAEYWDETGELHAEVKYEHGRKHGISKYWNLKDKKRIFRREYYVRGVRVRKKICLNPQELTADEVMKIRNAEVRRVALEQMGYERFLQQVDYKTIDAEGENELILINWREDEEPICLVKVKCSSAEVYYTLRVPPGMKTCKEAVAWTFHMDKKEYNPQEEA